MPLLPWLDSLLQALPGSGGEGGGGGNLDLFLFVFCGLLYLPQPYVLKSNQDLFVTDEFVAPIEKRFE